MDPTKKICKVKGFGEPRESWTIPAPYTLGKGGKLTVSLSFGSEPPGVGKFVASKKSVKKLHSIKSKFTGDKFIDSRNKTNPFENLGSSVFINRAGVKIANVDAVLKLTGFNPIMLTDSNLAPLTYAALADAPGAFVQYIQYRFPASKGFGISLTEGADCVWELDKLNMNRFVISNGKDGTGNLYTNAKWFADYVKKEFPQGVDVVTADGAVDSNGREEFQEQDNTRLIYAEFLSAISMIKVGGNYMFKVFDTFTDAMCHLLFFASLCFKEVYKFKPVSSRPANSEAYVVCKGRKEKITKYIALLGKINKSFTNDNYLHKIFANKQLPDDFKTWMIGRNKYSINRQTVIGNRIIKLMSGGKVEHRMYDLHKAFVLWNIPPTPVNLVFKKRRVSDRSAKEAKESLPVKVFDAVIPETGKEFKLIQEGVLRGGTYSRALVNMLAKIPEEEILITAASTDTIIVAFAASAKKVGKRATIFVNYLSDAPLVELARDYGAKVVSVYKEDTMTTSGRGNVVYVADNMANVRAAALKYYSNNGNNISYIGPLENNRTFRNEYSNAISKAFTFVPGTIWVAPGSMNMVNMLTYALRKTNFKVVATRKSKDPLGRLAKIVHTYPNSFKASKEVPPFGSYPIVGAKVWETFRNKARKGDYLFNAFSVEDLTVSSIKQPVLVIPEATVDVQSITPPGDTANIKKIRIPSLSLPSLQ